MPEVTQLGQILCGIQFQNDATASVATKLFGGLRITLILDAYDLENNRKTNIEGNQIVFQPHNVTFLTHTNIKRLLCGKIACLCFSLIFVKGTLLIL